MPKIAGMPGFRFAPGRFGALAARNQQEPGITTDGILAGMAKVQQFFDTNGVYAALTKSPYFVGENER